MPIKSIEDDSGMHCVDFMDHPDGTFNFRVFRKDPEDLGSWTLVGDYSGLHFQSENDAFRAAAEKVPWLTEVINLQPVALAENR